VGWWAEREQTDPRPALSAVHSSTEGRPPSDVGRAETPARPALTTAQGVRKDWTAVVQNRRL
jgi:hypothetical protein